MPGFSNTIVCVDESGDHSLESIDPQFPVFTLAFCLFEKGVYASNVAPAIQRFKFEHFGHDAVILHEREIRKQLGPSPSSPTGRGAPPFSHGSPTLLQRLRSL